MKSPSPVHSRKTVQIVLPIVTFGLLSCVASAQEDEQNLAKELANPIASLYTLPLQMNYDKDLGVNGDGSIWQLNA